jgi:hypothetical protein
MGGGGGGGGRGKVFVFLGVLIRFFLDLPGKEKEPPNPQKKKTEIVPPKNVRR